MEFDYTPKENEKEFLDFLNQNNPIACDAAKWVLYLTELVDNTQDDIMRFRAFWSREVMLNRMFAEGMNDKYWAKAHDKVIEIIDTKIKNRQI